ncbi:hypothetical protein K0M31_004483, partial [Melipona bicolor]
DSITHGKFRRPRNRIDELRVTPMLARDRRRAHTGHQRTTTTTKTKQGQKGLEAGDSRADRNGGIYETGYRDFPRVTGGLGCFLSPRQPESRIRFQPIVAPSPLSPFSPFAGDECIATETEGTAESNRRLWTHSESLLEFSFTSLDRSCDSFPLFFFSVTLTSIEISDLLRFVN